MDLRAAGPLATDWLGADLLGADLSASDMRAAGLIVKDLPCADDPLESCGPPGLGRRPDSDPTPTWLDPGWILTPTPLWGHGKMAKMAQSV